MPSPLARHNQDVLSPLVDRVLELAARPDEEGKKALWAQLNGLEPTHKIPVCLTYGSIRDADWEFVFGGGHLQCQSDPEETLIARGVVGYRSLTLSQYIEFFLKCVIWMAENVPDDHVVWPAVPIPAAYTDHHHHWGVDLRWQTGGHSGSAAIVPPFPDRVDWVKLRRARTDVDAQATRTRLEKARELVQGRLMTYPQYSTLGASPFEWMVRMRGLEQVYYDVYEAADLLHSLMDFVTLTIIADHERREKQGWLNFPPDPSGNYQMETTFRMVATHLPAGYHSRAPRLSDEWPYVSAQSGFGLGPGMYQEFVHQYNCRIAVLYEPGRVYYHGCENLDDKVGIIATLPNIGRHHVSPWSNVSVAAEAYQGSVVLEVHSHPANITLGASREEFRDEMGQLVAQADGHPMCLCVTDIHDIGGDPASLIRWAEAAQEVAA